MFRLVFVSMLALGAASLATPARAELVIVESLELRVAAAERVVIGTVVESQVLPYHSGGGWRWTLARLAVEETLRGPTTTEVAVLVRGGMVAGPWSAPGSRVLAFLDGRRPVEASEGRPPEAPADAWVAAPGASSLSDTGHGAILLSGKVPEIVTRDFRALRDVAAILTAARVAARAAAPGPVEAYALDAPGESDAHQLMYAGSAVMVRVPVDGALIAQARRWLVSKDVSQRVDAAVVLGKVPGKDVDAILKRLLTDQGVWLQTWSDGRRENLYPVRRAARDALVARGVAPGPVVVTEKLPPE